MAPAGRSKDAWNRGEYRLMLLQPASTCHGINLQDGGSTLVWYSIPWSLEHYDQTIGRLHRKGQTKPVMVIRIIANNTLDASVAAALKKKGYGNFTACSPGWSLIFSRMRCSSHWK